MYSFAFCLFIVEKKKNRKIKGTENKYTKELHRPGIEPGTSLAFYHCTDAYVEELLPKESS